MARDLLDRAGVSGRIPSGAAVSLKPNLVVARPADGGATTHPEAVAGVIEHLRDNGVREIRILEGSWVGDSTKRAFANCGYDQLAKRYGVSLHDLKDDDPVPVDTPFGPIRVCKLARDAEFLINLPVLKGHCQTRMTCAVKNLKGCIPDSEKRRFHREGLDRLVAGLAFAIRPALTLVDGICGDLDFEEGGNPVFAGRMALSDDMLAVDALGCRWLGIDPREVGYLRHAESQGAGALEVDASGIVELNRPDQSATPAPTGKAARIAGRIERRNACSACFANLVHALRRLDESGVSIPAPIRVGQGFRGKPLSGLGVGDCCSGAERFIAGCPPSALAVVESLSGNFT
ncbi:MAG: DUF362 domain-containing protein [Planctomycetota bacterium]|jgi:uncharacterized protein (DUF362 family)|nr:DUF362 domain-containing protein [Planctomycetota bacterium]